jgi:hypothetical protein
LADIDHEAALVVLAGVLPDGSRVVFLDRRLAERGSVDADDFHPVVCVIGTGSFGMGVGGAYLYMGQQFEGYRLVSLPFDWCSWQWAVTETHRKRGTPRP